MSLPDPQPIIYNGFQFPDNTETVGFECKPNYDTALRTVTYVDVSITVKSTIGSLPSPLVTTDLTMEAVKLLLLAPGGQFVYTNRGFGDFSINIPGSAKKDVKWGPRPQLVKWKPLGGDSTGMYGCEFVWTVEVCVPMNCTNPAYQFALLAVNYSMDFVVDRQGYTTRTMTGRLEIPMTRIAADNLTLTDCADAYFEKIFPTLPPGFRRTERRRRIDESKRVLTWTITDEEMPNVPLPPDVIECDFTHTVRSNTKYLGTSIRWMGQFQGTYTLARGVPKAVAAERFLAVVNDRLLETSKLANPIGAVQEAKALGNGNAPAGIGGGRVIANNKPNNVIFLSFSMSEKVYSREAASFSLSYSFMCSTSTILAASALWKPVPGSYDAWLATMATQAFAPRGNANLQLPPTADVIIDLCKPRQSVLVANLGGVAQLQAIFPGDVKSIFPPPSEESSWIDYQCRLEFDNEDSGVVRMKTIPLVPLTSTSLRTATLEEIDSDRLFDNAPRLVNNAMNPIPDIDPIQLRTTPSLVVYLVGYAVRVLYPIPAPQISSVGGVPVIADGGNFSQWTEGSFLYPVNCAAWRLKFIVPAMPVQTTANPPNPVAGSGA